VGGGGGPENWPDLVMVGRGIVPEKEQTEREMRNFIPLHPTDIIAENVRHSE
jgi:hypothetical protein